MKKFFRILVSALLVAELLFELGSCAYSTLGLQYDEVRTVGEIVSVEPQYWDFSEWYEEWRCYYIQLRPVGKGDNRELICFTVNCNTKMDSEWGADRMSIPELQVGAIVEITHGYDIYKYGDLHPDDVRTHYLKGYEAYSLRLYEGDYSGRQFVLRKSREYNYLTDTRSWYSTYSGSFPTIKVAHVSKIDYPMRGYIVYAEGRDYAYWISSLLLINTDTRRALESGAVGYSLAVLTESDDPFDNLYAFHCEFANINKAEDFEKHKKYNEYDISEFVGTKKILVRSDIFVGSEFYYYIKLESGEIAAFYAEGDKEGYTDLCRVSASGAPCGEVFPVDAFSGEMFISLESVGDVPACGKLIISFTPLENLEEKGILESE